jgi:hypothetical protein
VWMLLVVLFFYMFGFYQRFVVFEFVIRLFFGSLVWGRSVCHQLLRLLPGCHLVRKSSPTERGPLLHSICAPQIAN